MEFVNENGRTVLKYTPKTKDELKTMNCWEDCECNLEINKFFMYHSDKSGKDMPKITLSAYHPDGVRSQFIHEWIDMGDEARFHKRINEICECFGIEYNGVLDMESYVGKNGKGSIGTQHDKNGIYDSKNVIKKYLPKEKANDFKDDDLNDFL